MEIPSISEKKLCMIFFSMSLVSEEDEGFEDISYDVFVADLEKPCQSEEDGFIRPIAPSFRLEFDVPKSFCVFGSKLYIFESAGFGGEPIKYVHTLDLDSKTNKGSKLIQRSELGRICDMNHGKKIPHVTPTPDGKKILAFSSHFIFDPFTSPTAGDEDFELYDPDINKWTTLPGIQHDWMGYYHMHNKNGYVETGGFTFIGTSTFVVQIKGRKNDYGTVKDCSLMFSIDLNSIGNGWQQMHTFLGDVDKVIPYDGGRFFVMDDRLCVTPEGAYDVLPGRKFPEWVVFFPQPSHDEYDDDLNYTLPPFCISDVTLVVDNDVGKFHLCNLKVLINSDPTQHPCMEIHTLSCDLAKFKERGSAELSKSIPQSLRFRVDEPRSSFAKNGFFSF